MPPMTWDEVYQMYCLTAVATSERGALKLVQKVYKEYCDPTLGFRHVGQHARCATCARLAKTRRDSPDMLPEGARAQRAGPGICFHGVGPGTTCLCTRLRRLRARALIVLCKKDKLKMLMPLHTGSLCLAPDIAFL